MSELRASRLLAVALVVAGVLLLYGLFTPLGAPFTTSMWHEGVASERFIYFGAVGFAWLVAVGIFVQPQSHAAAAAMVLPAAAVLPFAVTATRLRGASAGFGGPWWVLIGGVVLLAAAGLETVVLFLGDEHQPVTAVVVLGGLVGVAVAVTWWVPYAWQSVSQAGVPAGMGSAPTRLRLVELSTHGWPLWPAAAVTVVAAALLARLLLSPELVRRMGFGALSLGLLVDLVSRFLSLLPAPATAVDRNGVALAITAVGVLAGAVLAFRADWGAPPAES